MLFVQLVTEKDYFLWTKLLGNNNLHRLLVSLYCGRFSSGIPSSTHPEHPKLLENTGSDSDLAEISFE